MEPKVAIIRFAGDVQGAFNQALQLIGGVDDLNSSSRDVVIKPGVFDHKSKNHPTVEVVRAIVSAFNKAPRIYLAESDNYRGVGLERLQLWKEVFTDTVRPINLSDVNDGNEINVADEKMRISRGVFKPSVFVSTHVLRKTEWGSIIKNLFGLVPEAKKARLHSKLPAVLFDIYKAIGGIDLAVIDATNIYTSIASDKSVTANMLIVGRDAIAVEVVGLTLLGLKLGKSKPIKEAVKRGIGETNIEKIEIVGCDLETTKKELAGLFSTKKKTRKITEKASKNLKKKNTTRS